MSRRVIIPDGTLIVYNREPGSHDPYRTLNYRHGIVIAHHPTMGWGGTPAYEVLVDGERMLLREEMVSRAGTRWSG